MLNDPRLCEVCDRPLSASNPYAGDVCRSCRTTKKRIPVWVCIMRDGRTEISVTADHSDLTKPTEWDSAHKGYMDGEEYGQYRDVLSDERMEEYGHLLYEVLPTLVRTALNTANDSGV